MFPGNVIAGLLEFPPVPVIQAVAPSQIPKVSDVDDNSVSHGVAPVQIKMLSEPVESVE